MDKWQPIESAPKNGMCVLLFYKNALGKPRTIVGEWTSFVTDEYDENDLEVRSEPGWYETSWASEEAHRVEGEPTHWMLLPDSPASGEVKS